MEKKARIVIIGAGMAGLTAANKLYTSSNNIFELSVVEGGSRIGGRINTSEFSNEKIELGATWIHGIGGSPVYKIAKEIDSLVSDEPWECMDSTIDKSRTFAEGGFEIEPSVVESISGLFNALMELATKDQILSFLKFTSTDQLNSFSSDIVSAVLADGSANGGPRLSAANGVWIDKSLSFKPSFKQLLEDSYKVSSNQADFQTKV